ncbi:P-loop containing nucleoside triphosphate hydrolase protein [Whalleya microplaca]|nr:P-loop containing nucleoside triphosphate hydrolase protein [Whalleya microplaca]
MTGSGKTTFISKVTGRKDLKIGHNLTSCTQEVQVVETKIDDRTVRFVDTPGFSDTHLSDTEVLEMIADYLAVAYSEKIRLSGIIYLHPISDTRVTHHATKNLEMFRKLTGQKNLKNVVLTTSMWDKVTPEEGERRERELREKFWTVLLAFGAQSVKYGGTTESARAIASMLIGNQPFYLQLQEEMGQGNALKDTAAGREIMQELVRMKEQHQKELKEMKEMMLQTSAEENKAAVSALEQHYMRMLHDMERTLADERRMNEDAVKSLNERISALEGRNMCAVM